MRFVEGARRSFSPGSWNLSKRVMASPLGIRLVRGAAWSALGTTTVRACSVVAMILVARGLGKAQFGALGVIQTTISMLQVLAGLGMGLTATRFVAEQRAVDPQRASRILGLTIATTGTLSIVFAGVLIALSRPLASGIFGSPQLTGPLRLGAGMLMFGTLQGAQLGILSGLEAFRTQAWAQAVGPILSIPMVVIGMRWGGLVGAIAGLLISMAVGWLVLYGAMRRELASMGMPIVFKGCLSEWRMMRDFGIPSLLASLLVAPVTWLCTAMLVRQPGGFGEMGIFSAVVQWRLAALHLPAVMGQVLVPVLSERVGAGDPLSAKKLLIAGISVNALLALAVGVPVCLLSRFIMRFYGAEFEAGWPTLVVNMLLALLVAVQSPVGTIIAVRNRMWIGFWMNLGWAVTTIGLSIYAVRYGALGLSLAMCAAYVVHGLWTGWFAARIFRSA